MVCKLCGTERPTNNELLCSECASALAQLRDDSARLLRGSRRNEAISSDPFNRRDSDQQPLPAFQIISELREAGEWRLRQPQSVMMLPDAAVLVIDRPDNVSYRLTRLAPDGERADELVRCSQGGSRNELSFPRGIDADAHGNVFVADAGNHRIQVLREGRTELDPIQSTETVPLNYPCDVKVDNSGALLVADTYNNRIVRMTPQGLILNAIEPDTDEQFDEPRAIELLSDGTVFVADTNHHRVVVINASDRITQSFGGPGDAPGRLMFPFDICITPHGGILVVDRGGRRVQVFSRSGECRSTHLLETIIAGDSNTGAFDIDDTGAIILANTLLNAVTRLELLTGASD